MESLFVWLLIVPAALALGGALGWYLHRLGESARAQALEANHREFLRAAGLARDRARTEAEEQQERFTRFRQEHEDCAATIDELRGKLARQRGKLSGHDSELAAARAEVEQRQARLAEIERKQQAAGSRLGEQLEQLTRRNQQLERELVAAADEHRRVEQEWARDREAHAGCSEVTSKLEARVRELEALVEQQADAATNGAPTWLLDQPAGAKDDLTVIRGLGPATERNLNEIGIYHYDQLAQLTDEDLDWIATRIHVFPGRIRKDRWADQALALSRESRESGSAPS